MLQDGFFFDFKFLILNKESALKVAQLSQATDLIMLLQMEIVSMFVKSKCYEKNELWKIDVQQLIEKTGFSVGHVDCGEQYT